MGLRREKLADQIRDILGQCFQAGMMNDPRLEGLTLTRVKVTSDLQLATIYFRLYDITDETKAQALVGLENSKGFLRKKLAASLTIRRVPSLRFFYDDAQDKLEHIEQILRKIKA